ncbi:MAG TPA: hypothetical protein VIK52_10325 [Opitutaceae bacterium]
MTSASVVLATLFVATTIHASKDSLVTSVYSSVSNGYTRKLAADGSPKPEYYAIARGKYLPGISRDQSIDRVEFPAVAGKVAEFLAGQGYYLAEDSKSADLLLLITWGTTRPFDDGIYRAGLASLSSAANLATQTGAVASAERSPDGIQSPGAAVANAAQGEFEGQLLQMQMFEDMRMKSNEHNAKLLGYIREINYRNNPSRFGGAGSAFDDLIADIESERYFVVVEAYDFRSAVKEQKPRLLWVTRVSIARQGNKFDRDMNAMLALASRYFGRESGRLVRQYHEGTVTFGELRVIGVVDESSSDRSKPDQ